MCDFVTPLIAALGAGGAGAATAAGATAAATTTAGALSTIGTVLSVGAPIIGGIQQASAARRQAAEIERQKQDEMQLNAQRENRAMASFQRQISDLYGRYAARGVDLTSPTVQYMGETAAREMAFQGQTIRSEGQATRTELTASQRLLRARGRQALFRGGVSGAARLAARAPDLWPELLS